jgi:UDP-N-acetylglucosamine:LPS N-acetylglucosamine transferase
MELLRLRPAFEGHHVIYATVDGAYRAHVGRAPLYVIRDATRWDKLALMQCAAQIALLIARHRPDVVITTGAAPGYFALVLGRRAGAKTVWVDSIANVEELSLSGKRAGAHADLWLTQWPELARAGGPEYRGAVL